MHSAEKHERLAMFREDLLFHDGSDAGFAVKMSRHEILNTLDLIPIDSGIASQHLKPPFRREFLIQSAHEREKLLHESRRSARGLAHFAPYFLEFRERNILSAYIAIQHGLVQRIAELDFDAVYLFRKPWVADQRNNEIVQVLHPMALGHGHDFVLVEG